MLGFDFKEELIHQMTIITSPWTYSMATNLIHEIVSAAEFKTHFIKIMDEVQQKKKNILITKRGIPVAKLVPIDNTGLSLFGWMKGDLEEHGTILEPLEIEWEVKV